MTPRVSVLLPCRDAAGHVDEAIASLRAQTRDDFEIVAVDDGSRDATVARLDELARTDPRLRVIRAPRLGLVPALNRGLAEARAPLIARMDADDVALPERLARQVAWMDAHPAAAACGTQVRYVPRAGLRDGARRYERWINAVVTPEEIERDLFVECPIPHPTLMIRRAVLLGLDGYRDRGWPEDYDLILRLRTAGCVVGKVPEVLLHWRERPDRLSRVDSRYDAHAFRRCKVWHLAHRLAGRRVVVWGAGPVGKAFALALLEAGHTVAAFVELDARKIGQEIHGAPVIAPDGIEAYRGCYVVAAVGQVGAREEIRAALLRRGWVEVEEFCAVA